MVMNDGATILKSLHVDNPAAKVLVGNSSLSEIKQELTMFADTHWSKRTMEIP
jgi:hypothetical protein